MRNDRTASTDFRVNRRNFVASLGVLGAMAGLKPLRGGSSSSPVATAGQALMKCRPYLQAPRRDAPQTLSLYS